MKRINHAISISKMQQNHEPASICRCHVSLMTKVRVQQKTIKVRVSQHGVDGQHDLLSESSKSLLDKSSFWLSFALSKKVSSAAFVDGDDVSFYDDGGDVPLKC